MVEISVNFMLPVSPDPAATARIQSALSLSILVATSAAFSFASCKEGWYYRCLGVDP